MSDFFFAARASGASGATVTRFRAGAPKLKTTV